MTILQGLNLAFGHPDDENEHAFTCPFFGNLPAPVTSIGLLNSPIASRCAPPAISAHVD
jgi:hypothetical protein